MKINNTEIIIHQKGCPKREHLLKVYEICNRIFSNDDCFYSKNDVIKLKKDKSNIFI